MPKVDPQLRESVKKMLKDQLGGFFAARLGNDAQALTFAMEMVDANIDLIIDAIEKGRPPSKAEVALWLAKKGVSGAKALNANQQAACALAVVDLGLTASQVELVGGGPIGITAYAGFLLLAGIDAGGECYLAYLDYETEQKIAQLAKKLEQDRIRRHAAVSLGISNGPRSLILLEREMNAFDYYDEKERMCRAPRLP